MFSGLFRMASLIRRPAAAMLALAVTGTGAATAQGAVEIDLMLHNVSAQAFDQNEMAGFNGESHTGWIQFGYNEMAGMETDLFRIATPEASYEYDHLADYSVTAFSGLLSLDDGLITGGSFWLEVSDELGNANSLTFDVNGGSDSIVDLPFGLPYVAQPTTSGNMFDDVTFAGVDVSRWASEGGLPGRLSLEGFSPDTYGYDEGVDLKLTVAVPLPVPAAMGAALLGGLAAVRQYRRRCDGRCIGNAGIETGAEIK